MRNRLKVSNVVAILFAGALSLPCLTARGDLIADFNGLTLGTTTPITQSIATFTSSPSATAFDIQAVAPLVPVSYAGPLNGNLLYETGNLDTLTVSFSVPVTNPTFDLLISDSSSIQLTTDTGISAGVSGGVLDSGDPNSHFETGVTILDTIKSITLSGARNVTFGIDNLNGTFTPQSSVPEPGAIAFLLGSCLPAAWLVRRHRRY